MKNEEEIYQFENKNVKDNIQILKALSLSFMLARNPKEQDGPNKLKEIFIKDQNLHKQVKEQIGFHFHNAMKNENEAH